MADIRFKAWLTSNIAKNLVKSALKGNLRDTCRTAIFGTRLAWYRATGKPVPAALKKYTPRKSLQISPLVSHYSGVISVQETVTVDDIERLIAKDPIAANSLIQRIKGGRIKAKLYSKCAHEFFQRWDLARALRATTHALARNKTDVASHRLKAEILIMAGRVDEAREAAATAFSLNPLDVKSLQLLAKFETRETVSSHLDRVRQSVEEREWSRLATMSAVRALYEFGRIEEGLDLLEQYRSKTTDPKYDPAEADLQTGVGLVFDRRFDVASEWLEKVKDHPQYGKTARVHLAECYFELGDPDKTVEVYSKAYPESIRPRAFNLFYFLATARYGDMRKAWEEYRFRGFSFALRKFVKGSYVQEVDRLPSDGTVFMIAEGGPGDELRFASLYPELNQRLNKLTISCEPRLWSLLQRSFPAVRFVPVSRWRKEMIPSDPKSRAGLPSAKLTLSLSMEAYVIAEKADAFCSVCDTLVDLRPTRESFVAQDKSYLAPRQDQVETWSRYVRDEGVDGLRNVAISWRSLLRHVRRDMHYLDVQDLVPLKEVDATFWLFQPMLEEEEVSALREFLPNVRVIGSLDLKDDFEGMAGFLTCMDAVVAPCNTTAELAGALGVPTLFFGRTEGAKWRVREDGTDIWHPSVRSVLGNPLGDRQATAEAIAAELRRMLN